MKLPFEILKGKIAGKREKRGIKWMIEERKKNNPNLRQRGRKKAKRYVIILGK